MNLNGLEKPINKLLKEFEQDRFQELVAEISELKRLNAELLGWYEDAQELRLQCGGYQNEIDKLRKEISTLKEKVQEAIA